MQRNESEHGSGWDTHQKINIVGSLLIFFKDLFSSRLFRGCNNCFFFILEFNCKLQPIYLYIVLIPLTKARICDVHDWSLIVWFDFLRHSQQSLSYCQDGFLG